MRLFSRQTGLVLLSLLGFSLLLTWAQLSQKAAIIGSDAIFHYNRFYDTAMQIKTGHYDYVISLFGYQGSGRVVNALYGPFFAYAQGLLVLISGNWFNYQILSRLLLSLLAGGSLYGLLRQLKVRSGLALSLSLLFLTTYALRYWGMRQGFSSWGVAFFPLCLRPAITAAQTKTSKPLPLAMAVALMLQVHTLSALLLVLSYLPFFGYALLTSKAKWALIRQVALAVAINLLLTANVWLPLLSLSQSNQLLAPFVNKNLAKHTIDRAHQHLLAQPQGLGYLLLLPVPLAPFLTKKKGQALYQLCLACLLGLLLLSSSLFPWDHLAGQGIQLVEVIQFPFRFFLIATVFLLICLGLGLSQTKILYPYAVGLVLALASWGVYQTIQEENQWIDKHYWSASPILLRKHTKLVGSPEQVRESLHSSNLKTFLDLALKSTPDYLPIYHETKANKYRLYQQLVLDQNPSFSKTTDDGQLVVTWTADDTHPTNLPVVVYDGTQLTLNGQVLDLTKKALSPIGTPTVTPQVGKNRLSLTYVPTPYLYPAIWLSIGTWLLVLTSSIYQTYKNSRHCW